MGFPRHLRLCLSRLAAGDGTASPVQPPLAAAPPTRASSLSPLRPGIAAIVGALTVMFSVTFLILLYAKHCKRGDRGGHPASSSAAAAGRRNSGVDRAVVESLPLFRFGSLEGHKEGLECAVCLARFEPAELLRLLPKCQHAFHVECVGTWLDAHSTCPICRARVDPEDVLLIPEPPPPVADEKGDEPPQYGRRVSGRHSSAGEKTSNLQVVVHRTEPDDRRSADSAARPVRTVGSLDKRRKDVLLLAGGLEGGSVDQRFGHRIVVSCGGDELPERWSDLRPSDLLLLRSEMIITDSGRYSVSRAARASCSSSFGGTGVITSSSARCASEITGVCRQTRRYGGKSGRDEEEGTMRRWAWFEAKRKPGWGRGRSRESGDGA